MLWLLILMGVVVVILIFLLGSYSVKGSNDVAPYPTKDEKCSRSSSGGTSMSSTSCQKASQAKGSNGFCKSGAASVDDDDKPCKKHRKRKCSVCHKDESDGFSGVFSSSPAPFTLGA